MLWQHCVTMLLQHYISTCINVEIQYYQCNINITSLRNDCSQYGSQYCDRMTLFWKYSQQCSQIWQYGGQYCDSIVHTIINFHNIVIIYDNNIVLQYRENILQYSIQCSTIQYSICNFPPLCNNIVIIYGNSVVKINTMVNSIVKILFTILPKWKILFTVLLHCVHRETWTLTFQELIIRPFVIAVLVYLDLFFLTRYH